MSLRLSGLHPLAYMGVEPVSPALFITQPDSPTVNDWQNFNVGTVWLNTTSQVPYMLVSLASNQATWIPLGSSADISTLMGNSGTASGNIITVTTGAGNTQGTALFTGDNASTLSLTFSDGNGNTGIGTNALSDVTSGANNVAIGSNSLVSLLSTDYNVAIGRAALFSLEDGSFNIGIGGLALGSLITGDNNIAIGDGAGEIYTSSESSNILIGNTGVLAESHTIHIGTQGSALGEQNACYIAGIYGNTDFSGSPTYVGIDNRGYLGVLSGGGSGGATNFITNSGDAAVDGSGNISILGTTNNITTAALPNTVTINVGGHVATSFTTDDSTTINPSANNIIIHGTGNVTTSSSGHTITINGSGGGASRITFFTTTGTSTWTKAAGTNMVAILGWGGGGGGASGSTGTPNSFGGGGGAPTSCFYWMSPANFFGATETAFVGSGGAGGAAISASNTTGNPGADGTASYFGNIKPESYSFGFNGGQPTSQAGASVGGQFYNFVNALGVITNAVGLTVASQFAQAPSTYFGANYSTSNPMEVGGLVSNSGGAGGNGADIGGKTSGSGQLGYVYAYFFPTSGGAGGSGGAAVSGGRGGNVFSMDALSTLLAGGAGGTSGGNGSNGNKSINTDGSQLITGGLIYGGTGGGGGGGGTTGGTGGNGGFPGGGGGGGGGSLNGSSSGAGGNGANGLIVVIEW